MRGTTWRNGEDVIGAVRLPNTTPWPTIFSLHPSFARVMSQFPDYYAILSIPKTATAEEIRSAYKRESLRYVVVPRPLLVWRV